jgi:hypothetical protein
LYEATVNVTAALVSLTHLRQLDIAVPRLSTPLTQPVRTFRKCLAFYEALAAVFRAAPRLVDVRVAFGHSTGANNVRNSRVRWELPNARRLTVSYEAFVCLATLPTVYAPQLESAELVGVAWDSAIAVWRTAAATTRRFVCAHSGNYRNTRAVAPLLLEDVAVPYDLALTDAVAATATDTVVRGTGTGAGTGAGAPSSLLREFEFPAPMSATRVRQLVGRFPALERVRICIDSAAPTDAVLAIVAGCPLVVECSVRSTGRAPDPPAQADCADGDGADGDGADGEKKETPIVVLVAARLRELRLSSSESRLWRRLQCPQLVTITNESPYAYDPAWVIESCRNLVHFRAHVPYTAGFVAAPDRSREPLLDATLASSSSSPTSVLPPPSLSPPSALVSLVLHGASTEALQSLLSRTPHLRSLSLSSTYVDAAVACISGHVRCHRDSAATLPIVLDTIRFGRLSLPLSAASDPEPHTQLAAHVPSLRVLGLPPSVVLDDALRQRFAAVAPHLAVVSEL